jgi:hypothetical protein
VRPPLAVASCRKFDKYGDWYLIPETFHGLYLLLFARRKLEAFIEHHWYEDEERSRGAD